MTPERRRELDALAEAMAKPYQCPILQLMRVAGGIQGAAVTQQEIDELEVEVLGPRPAKEPA